MEETYERSIFDEEASVVYGGFWERFGALFLDGIILAPLSVLSYFNNSSWKSLPLLFLITLALLLYKPLLEYLYGATPGKKALSLTIVNSHYNKIHVRDAVLRNIFGIVTGLISLAISVYTFDRNLLYTNKITASTDLNELAGGAVISVVYGVGVFFLYAADSICLVANNKKQSLHDLIAKTYVIRK